MKNIYKFFTILGTIGGVGTTGLLLTNLQSDVNNDFLSQQEDKSIQTSQVSLEKFIPSSYSYRTGQENNQISPLDARIKETIRWNNLKTAFIEVNLQLLLKNGDAWFFSQYAIDKWEEKIIPIFVEAIKKDLSLSKRISFSKDERHTYFWSAIRDLQNYGVAKNLPPFMTE